LIDTERYRREMEYPHHNFPYSIGIFLRVRVNELNIEQFSLASNNQTLRHRIESGAGATSFLVRKNLIPEPDNSHVLKSTWPGWKIFFNLYFTEAYKR
jgi:hypothetical protein